MEKFEEVRRKVFELARNVIKEMEQTEKTDDQFIKMSEKEQREYLYEQKFLNGQLSGINQVLQIIKEG